MRHSSVPGLLLVALLFPVYAGHLERAPIALVSDEANFGSQAASLVATGRDINGMRLPLFFLIKDPLTPDGASTIWYQPFLFYAVAASLWVFPITEWSIRLPNALLALGSIWLVYVIAFRLFGRRSYALVAAVMFGIMPANVVMSRRALDYVCPLPFALLWFLCVDTFRESRQLRYMVIGGLALGVGLYSYIAAWALMPFLLLITPLAVADTGQVRRAALTIAAAFTVPLLPLAYWLIRYPETLQTLVRYQIPIGQPATLMDRIARLANFDLGERISLYWDYFNPSFLFFSGGSNLAQAGTGVLPLSMAVFLPIGFYHLVRRGSPSGRLLLAVLLFAPVPIVITLPDTPQFTIARALIVLPFAALVATYGVQRLWASPRTIVRGMTVVLLVAMPLQFAGFIRDYFTDYQLRTARLSDPLNTAGVATYLFSQDAREPIPAIYLPSNVKGAAWIWKFLTLEAGRPDMWTRTREFDPDRGDARSVAAGSLLVFLEPSVTTGSLLDGGGFSVATVIRGLDGEAAALVLRKEQ